MNAKAGRARHITHDAHDNEKDFHDFYIATYPKVVKYLTGLSHSARYVEDATQEAMAAVYIKWPILKDDMRCRRKYVLISAKRMLIRMLNRPDSRYLPLESSSIDSQPCENADQTQVDTDVMTLLRELSDKQREAVILAWICDLPEREVADIMDVHPGTVKSHLSRARKKLATNREVLNHLQSRRYREHR